VKAIYADILFISDDTRTESALWIKAHLRPGASIAVDHTFFRPALKQNKNQYREKYKLIGNQQGLEGIKEKKLKIMLDAQEEGKYYIYFLSTNPESQGQFFSTMRQSALA
jgi:hypothetical protein